MSVFYFVIRLPTGLEMWVLDEGQPPPANTVRREAGRADLMDDGA
jgi:hypothetical protein